MKTFLLNDEVIFIFVKMMYLTFLKTANDQKAKKIPSDLTLKEIK